jgi:hypothetical protein
MVTAVAIRRISTMPIMTLATLVQQSAEIAPTRPLGLAGSALIISIKLQTQ